MKLIPVIETSDWCDWHKYVFLMANFLTWNMYVCMYVGETNNTAYNVKLFVCCCEFCVHLVDLLLSSVLSKLLELLCFGVLAFKH